MPSIYPTWYIHQMGSDLLPYQGSAIYLSHVLYTSDAICPVTLSRQCHLSIPRGIYTRWDLTCYLIKAVPSIYPMWYVHQIGSDLLPYQGSAIYLSHVVYTSHGICPVTLSRQCHLSIPCGIYIRWDLSCYLIKAVPSIYLMGYIHQI